MARKLPGLLLPNLLVGRGDVVRLGRELEQLSDRLDQAALRRADSPAKTESKAKAVPSTITASSGLTELVEANQLDLSKGTDRQQLAKFLDELKRHAPSIHMSFAAEPPANFTAKLVDWLRREIHPLVLLEIGLQPSIAAGCIIRTNSKYFDCSMRQHLLQNRTQLIERLKVATT